MDIALKLLTAFAVGGAFCLIGQILIDYTKLTPARILTSYVVAGVILGGVGLYAPLVDFAGAGATVPLTGFGYALSEGVRTAVDEIGLLGALSGGLTATATGIAAAICAGIAMSLIFKSGDK
ncbi:MAG: stage V sporulation protein AE [Clostridia bacterium]|nr:stage V sporulation protein AE [Clostridia bacterium]